MAFRGRGRGFGRGGGRGSFFENRHTKHEPYILFPEDVNLPDLPVYPLPLEEKLLINWKIRLENFWKHSCYHLEEVVPKSKKQVADIERYSDRFNKSKAKEKREALEHYLKLNTLNFPPELVQGSKPDQPDNKKLRWGRDSDEFLDIFVKLEEKDKDNDGEGGKEKKGESDDEEEKDEVEEESSDDGDYNQNIDFDDDEDDMNMAEEEQEDYYEQD